MYQRASDGRAMAPTPKLKQAGARIALGTDNLTQDITEPCAVAGGRAYPARLVSDQWQPRDAFAMATSWVRKPSGALMKWDAWRLAILPTLSSSNFRHPHLTPLLDRSGTLVHDAGGRDVEHVFVDGRQVIANGLPTLADATRVRADAQRAAEALWARRG